MSKVLPFLLFFTLLSCKKEIETCGTVYSVPDPVFQSNRVLYYVCARISNGNFVWLEVSREQYDSAKVGQWVCCDR